VNFVKADVQTIVLGMAASMGSFLLTAGQKGKRFALPTVSRSITSIGWPVRSAKIEFKRWRVSKMWRAAISILLTAGQKGKRFALPNAEIMIHQPLGGAQGQATDHILLLVRQSYSYHDRYHVQSLQLVGQFVQLKLNLNVDVKNKKMETATVAVSIFFIFQCIHVILLQWHFRQRYAHQWWSLVQIECVAVSIFLFLI
jgi:hypothetical protein